MTREGPPRFGWILPGELAGSGRPGRSSPLSKDLEFLRAREVVVIISLLESPLNLEEYREGGFEVYHFPVEDFTAPELSQIEDACTIIEDALERGSKVLIHCNAGIGRTGTLLASFLVHRGVSPDEAVHTIRRKRPFSLETAEQVHAVHEYHESRRRHRD